jgi:hypothetical protein
MKKKSSPVPPEKPAAGRVSRYQRLLAQQGKKGVAGRAPAVAPSPAGSGDSYRVIAEAIRVMLREP